MICPEKDVHVMLNKYGVFFFLHMEVSLRDAQFVYCGKACTITTHESQHMSHSETLACEHDTTT